MPHLGEPSRDADLPIDPDLAPGDPAEPRVDHYAAPRVARMRRTEPSVLTAIALGGALGAPARYGVAQLIRVAPNTFP